jgi:hypothetical protein
MKKVGLLCLVMLLISHVVSAEEKILLREFQWLLGCWKGQVGRNTYCENWIITNHNSLEGTAYMLNPQGEIIFSEVLRIDKIGSHVVYIAAINNNHPVLFTLNEILDERKNNIWVFGNKEHDFPQQIVYYREAPDSLNASVEGNINGKEVKEEFHLKREK